MDKKRYYVSVQANTVLEQQGDAAYEFEIDATDKELMKLQELFENKEDVEDETFLRAPIPAFPYHQDGENDAYDENIRSVYRLLHQLGTAETKQHIDQMGILQ